MLQTVQDAFENKALLVTVTVSTIAACEYSKKPETFHRHVAVCHGLIKSSCPRAEQAISNCFNNISSSKFYKKLEIAYPRAQQAISGLCKNINICIPQRICGKRTSTLLKEFLDSLPNRVLEGFLSLLLSYILCRALGSSPEFSVNLAFVAGIIGFIKFYPFLPYLVTLSICYYANKIDDTSISK